MLEEVKQHTEQNDFVDLANVRSQDQMKVYLDILERNIDPFGSLEEILALGNELLYDLKHCWVIRNKFYTDRKHHFVLIMKEFAQSPEDLSDEVYLAVRRTVKQIKHDHNITGGMFGCRFGDSRLSGASVKRLHFHLIEPHEKNPIPFWVGSNVESTNKKGGNNE